jgi:hypothetical protein
MTLCGESSGISSSKNFLFKEMKTETVLKIDGQRDFGLTKRRHGVYTLLTVSELLYSDLINGWTIGVRFQHGRNFRSATTTRLALVPHQPADIGVLSFGVNVTCA